MERLLRGLMSIQDSPSVEDGVSNWNRFQDNSFDFRCAEDKKIHRYLVDYYSALSAPPAFELVREYFEKSDDIEVVSRLDDIKKAQLYTRTNYQSILRAEAEAQRAKNFVFLCRDAAAIAEHGRALEKPVNGKKNLRGPADALAFFEKEAAKLQFDSDGWDLSGPSEVAEEIAPIKYLMRHFQLAEGRPNVLAGYAGSAKTFLAIELALACASGKTCWGGLRLSVSGPVVHLDYEMGRKLLFRRYQRVAFGMGIDLNNIRGEASPKGLREAIERGFQSIATKEVRKAEVSGASINPDMAHLANQDHHSNADLLKVTSFPKLYLHSPGAEQAFIKLCTGKALLIIDSFRAATAGSGVDENNSEMRVYFDMLSKVSDRTGCVIIVLHHERKSGKDSDSDDIPIIQRLRGSSGLADAVGATVHIATNSKGIRVEQGKVSAGRAGKSFTLQLKDVGEAARDGEDTEGLQLALAEDEDDSERNSDLELVSNVIRAGRANSYKRIYELCHAAGLKKKSRVEAAVRALFIKKNSEGIYEVGDQDDIQDLIS